MTPAEFWDSSWYELNLRSKHYHLQQEKEWNHTRHILAALTGERPSKIMPLSFDKKSTPAPTAEDQQRIIAKYQNLKTVPNG